MIGSTQPNKSINHEPKKTHRARSFLISALILIVILAIVIFAGYQAGIGTRKVYESSELVPQLAEQFQLADSDMQAGRYEIAQQRLEWIISHDPSYPGVQDKLTQVLVQVNLQQGYHTPTPTPTLTPTPDLSAKGAEQAFTHAQELLASQDWQGALATLDSLRKIDANYEQGQVDGMYYFALRNYGYDLITKQGNLEGGIYQLTLAERFGPLDRDANGLREGARVYIIGASFWELDWSQAVYYFEQARNWGNLWDGTMTASERYWYAAMRYGDELFAQKKICKSNEALSYYQSAQTIAALDKVAQKNYNDALLICFPPTDTPAPITNTPAPTSYP